MAHYLVTGGAGFIGSHLVRGLAAQGERVRVLDNFSSGNRTNLAGLEGLVEVAEGDITRLGDVSAAVQDVDYVLHQAAVPSVPRSIEEPLPTHDANITGTLNVLLAARDAGVRRVVFASSSSVYGDQAELTPKAESMPLQPISPYGAHKAASELYCRVFYQAYGLETVALRYFNVFGPRQDPNSAYAAVIPRFIQAMLRGERPTIFGDGEQTRDFTFIGNVVQGNLLAAQAPAQKVAGRVFNLAAGGQVSLNQLVDHLNHLLNCDIRPVYAPARTGDIKHSQADVSLARQVLGFEPAFSLEEGLRQTIQWYSEQR